MTPSAAVLGSVGVGGTITIPLTPGCAWTPGSTITVTVNGVNIPGKVANAAGATTVVITVLSPTQLSVDDPVLTPAQCGANTVSGRGPSTATQTGSSSHTATFTVLCPGVTPTNVTKSGRVALTGANLARWSVIAFGLILVGGGFVLADRRKARARD